jgi:hypothetical protein
MAASDFVTAVNEKTGLVSAVPAHYLDVYPEYKELSEEDIIRLRRKTEKEMFGEYITPAPAAKAAAEATKEGSK